MHDKSTLKYVTKSACQNPMSVSCVHFVKFAQYISMISMNMKHVYSEWYDKEIDNACILRDMIGVRDERSICDIYNIEDVDFIIN